MTLTPEQLAMRRRGIGASEAPAVVGVNPWAKPIDVYMRKLGLVDEQPETPRMRAGNKLERTILEWGAEELGLTVLPTGTETLRHPELTWLFATPDGRIVLPRAGRHEPGPGVIRGAGYEDLFGPIVQVKNVGDRSARYWGESGTDEIPDYVRIQVEVELEVTGQPEGWVFALLGGYDLRTYPIKRDPVIARGVIEICQRFWFEHVVAESPPALDGSPASHDFLAKKFPQHSDEILVATPAAERLMERLREAERAAARAEAEADEARAQLKALIGDRAGIESYLGRVTWKKTASGGIDYKALAEEMKAPRALIEKHRRPGSRRFLCKWREDQSA